MILGMTVSMNQLVYIWIPNFGTYLTGMLSMTDASYESNYFQ